MLAKKREQTDIHKANAARLHKPRADKSHMASPHTHTHIDRLKQSPIMLLKWLVVVVAFGLGIGSKYAKRKLPLVPVDLEGKHFIVTGASAGIGKETVRTLAQWNASVVMAVRNVKKGEAVLEVIRASLGGRDIPVEVWEMDLSKFSSVQVFAAKYIESGRPLNVLINNAGLVSWDYILTENGHELTHQTNHLGHFLLTKLLMGPLQASAPSRVIQVSSEAHYMGKIDLGELLSGLVGVR
jgi:hypothetical protein